MSEKRVYAAPHSFTPFFGAPDGQNRPRNRQTPESPFAMPCFRQTKRASGAFTLPKAHLLCPLTA